MRFEFQIIMLAPSDMKGNRILRTISIVVEYPRCDEIVDIQENSSYPLMSLGNTCLILLAVPGSSARSGIVLAWTFRILNPTDNVLMLNRVDVLLLVICPRGAQRIHIMQDLTCLMPLSFCEHVYAH